MQKAKQAVSDFISNDGKHKTTVDEESRPAVTEEHVRPHQHENVTTAIDKSVHQDHHHTTVQPITAKETLPEQHSHKIMPVEHKTVDHGNSKDLKETLDRDAARFQDSSTTHSTTHSATVAPVAKGERIHHHVHEHVQPVIQKETIAPQVVHTTVPIHETHHNAPVHHGTSVLPAESLESFNSGKGTLQGREATKVTEFDGCPKPYKNDLQTETLSGDKNMHLGKSSTGGTNALGSESSGMRSNNALGSEGFGMRNNNALGGSESSAMRNNNTLGSESSTKRSNVMSSEKSGNYTHSGADASGFGGAASSASVPRGAAGAAGAAGAVGAVGTAGAAGAAGTTDRQTRSGTSGSGTQAKPSLMDKLNPMKDADRDGKTGLMD